MMDRRTFARLAVIGAGVAAINPRALTAAQPIVRLSSNENPFGPSPAALQAIRETLPLANRYPDEYEQMLTADLARLHSVGTEHVLLGNGSSELLKFAALAFTGPGRPIAVANPTFEAIARHAKVSGADVIEVPLTADFRHDLGRMLDVKGAGLIYICNPNNPTASITPKEELRLFVGGIPAKTIVLVDEAYHHYVESDRYESLIPMVQRRRNLVVLRTFSKIYGMAGLRCGYAIGSADVIEQMRRHQPWNNINLAALAAARASLADTGHVERNRRRNSETRRTVIRRLDEMGFATIASQANFFMVNVGRDVRPVIDSLRQRGVHVGRLFPALPTHLRVSIGTPAEMEKFLEGVTPSLFTFLH